MPKNCTGFQKYFFNMTNSLCVPSFFLSYRATAKPGLSFSTARTSDSTLWDISVNPDRESSPNSVSVVCHRKVATTAKRSVFHMYRTWTETWRPWLVNLIWKKKECTKKEKEKKHFNFSGTTNSYNIIYTKKVSNLHSIPCVFSDLIHVCCCYLESRSVNLNLKVLTSVAYFLLGREHSYAESWVRCKKLNNSCLWGITVKGN